MKLAVITPVRDESEYICKIIHSMKVQRYKPTAWILIDDGSTDNTANIIKQETKGIEWIHLISRSNRGYRMRGAGVVESFYDGIRFIGNESWDLVSKLDADLSLEPNYFEFLVNAFRSDPQLGISSGCIYEQRDGKWVPDQILPTDFVRGQCKVYRMSCFDSIQGLVPHQGWDGIDNVKAILRGWRVHRFDQLHVKHYRPIGALDGQLKSVYMGGRAFYFMGSDPLFILYRSLSRLHLKPRLIGSLAMLYGYWESLLLQREQIDDPDVIAFIKRRERELIGQHIYKW